MIQAHLHKELLQACEHGSVEDVQKCLDAGADTNFNIEKPINALNAAIKRDNSTIIKLLLEHGAIVKEFVLQQAIEKDKNYLELLIPNFKECKEESLLMGVLQAAISIGDEDLAKQAIYQGAKPEALVIYAIANLTSAKILELLLKNGFNIHSDANKIFSQWMGSPAIDYKSRPVKLELLAFVSEYYLEKPDAVVKFSSSILDKKRLFRLGLNSDNFNMMKFAILIGANKNEALNAVLYRLYDNKQERKTIYYEIIEYILNSNMTFEKISISNAVCFKYSELLNALSRMDDLEYGYEMAYNYKDDDLCEYFISQGVSKEAQSFAKMRVSAIKGDIKELRNAASEGADLRLLDTETLVEIINKNQVESLKYLYKSGLLFDSSLNRYIDSALNSHKAYESISYLIELGLDISSIKNMPQEYKKSYPLIADIWKKRFSNIFEYTIYLAKEEYPNLEAKEKEETLKIIAELSSLPYVIKCSQGKSL